MHWVVIVGMVVFLVTFLAARREDPQRNRLVKTDANFDDYIGNKELKGYLRKILHDFRQGKSPVRGLIVVGPPGSGKSYLAQVIAGQFGLRFYDFTSAHTTEIFVAAKTLARQKKKAIIFIDEIHNIVDTRVVYGDPSGLLNAMSGLQDSTIFFVGATTREDMSVREDFARPGRFSEIWHLKPLTAPERVEVLKYYSSEGLWTKDFNWDQAIADTDGMTPQDLKYVAQLLEAERTIDPSPVDDEAFRTALKRRQRVHREKTEKEKLRHAVHEIGHFLVAEALGVAGTNSLVTVKESASGSLAHFEVLAANPRLKESRGTRQALANLVMVAIGGVAATRHLYEKSGDDDWIDVGFASDLGHILPAIQVLTRTDGLYGTAQLDNATGSAIFRQMLSEAPTVVAHDPYYGAPQTPKSDPTVSEYSYELYRELLEQTREVIEEHDDILLPLSEKLVQEEALFRRELLAYMAELRQ